MSNIKSATQDLFFNNPGISFKSRFTSGKVWCPDLIWIADSFGFGSPEEEIKIHKRFSDCSIGGEWFDLTPELAFYIWDNLGMRTYTDLFISSLRQVCEDKAVADRCVERFGEGNSNDIWLIKKNLAQLVRLDLDEL